MPHVSTRQVPSHHRWVVFALSTSLFFLSQFYRVSNAVIAPYLLRDLALDTEGLGILSAVFFYAFALTQIPISLLLDKVGARMLMTLLSVVGVLGGLVFSWADTMAAGVAGRVLMGAGMACNLMGTFKLLTHWFKPRIFATLIGVVIAIGTVGNMVAATPLVLLVEHLGWRVSFQLIAAVNLILALLFCAVVRDRPPQTGAAEHESVQIPISLQQAFGNLGLLLRQKDYWIISVGTLVRYGVYAAFQALWAGPFLMETLAYSAVAAGNIILLLNLGMILGAPFWGGLSDRVLIARKTLVITGLAGTALIIAALTAVAPTTPLAVVSLLFFSFGFFNGAGTLMYPHIKERMPPEMAGVAMTGINFFNMVGPAVFLQGLGTLMQTLHPQASRGPEAFNTAFLVCLAGLAGAAALYGLSRK